MTACWQASKPASPARYFAALAAAPHGMPWSYCQAADSVISQAASSSIQFLRKRMLDRLVLADRTVEHDALARISRRALERQHAEPDRLGRDQDALGIHAVQDVLEAPALLADAVGDRNLEILDEQLVRIDALCAPSSRSRGP